MEHTIAAPDAGTLKAVNFGAAIASRKARTSSTSTTPPDEGGGNPPGRARVRILLQMPGTSRGMARRSARALPDAEIAVWPDAPATSDYTLVWRPPPELFACMRTVQAIFNLGAGVDGLMTVPTFPRDVPVVRLEDAGMAEQMVEVRDARRAARVPRNGRLRCAAARRALATAAAYRQVRIRHWLPGPRRPWAGDRRRCSCLSVFRWQARVAVRRRRRVSSPYAGLAELSSSSRRTRARLSVAVDSRDAGRCSIGSPRGAACRRARRQRRARRPHRRRGPHRAARLRATSPARRSTCFATSRCRPAIRSGIIRGSP